MNISNRPFGCLPDGRAVTCWTLTNDAGLQTEILDYGVTIRTLVVPDRNGKPVDVVLGYDTLEEYAENGKQIIFFTCHDWLGGNREIHNILN